MIECYFILKDQQVVVAWVPAGNEVIRLGPDAVPFVYDRDVKENGRTMRVYLESSD